MLPEERPGYRIADRDRDRVVAVLRMHCTEGRISLEEFSDRVGLAYDARTSVELDEVVRDLPMPWEPNTPALHADSEDSRLRRRRPVRWLVAVFGSSAQRGRYRLSDECAALAVFGDCILDLTEALIEDSVPEITAVACFGNVTIVVPEGIEVDVDGVAIFGDKRSDAPSGPLIPGSPVIHVRAFALFGDVRVRSAGDRDRRRSGGFGRR
jgi:hypothetical protein